MSKLHQIRKLARANAESVYPVGSRWTNGANVLTVNEVCGDHTLPTPLCVDVRLTDAQGELHMLYLDEMENLSAYYA
jgi:hypothetical protein